MKYTVVFASGRVRVHKTKKFNDLLKLFYLFFFKENLLEYGKFKSIRKCEKLYSKRCVLTISEDLLLKDVFKNWFTFFQQSQCLSKDFFPSFPFLLAVAKIQHCLYL